MTSRLLYVGLALACLLGWGSVNLVAAEDTASDVAEVEPGDHAESGEHSDDHEGAAEHGIHDPYEDALHGNAGEKLEDVSEIRSSLSLWTLVVFGLLLAVLWKFAWGPLAEALDKREAGIQANIEKAEQQNAKASQLLADHEARLAGTADEVRRILDEARRDADAQKQQILADAQAASEAEKRRALQEIEAAKNGALQELAERSVDTAVGLAGKIVQRQLSPDEHASLITEALEHFPSSN